MTYFQETPFTQREHNLLTPLGLNPDQMRTLEKNKNKVLGDRETLDLLANIRRACGQRQSLDTLSGPSGLGSCAVLLRRFESEQQYSTFGPQAEPAITNLGERPRRPEGLQEQGTIQRATPGLDRRDNTLNNVRQQTDAERVAAEVAARGANRGETQRIRAQVRQAVESAGPTPAPSRDNRIESATAFIRMSNPAAERERTQQQRKERETRRETDEVQVRETQRATTAQVRQVQAQTPQSTKIETFPNTDKYVAGLNADQRKKFAEYVETFKQEQNSEGRLKLFMDGLNAAADAGKPVSAAVRRYLNDAQKLQESLNASLKNRPRGPESA